MQISRVQLRAMVVLGFVVSALAQLISYFFNISTGGYQFSSFRVVIDPMLAPLTTIAAVVAWWWLTKLEARDDAQRTILGRAYLFFAIQYVITAATFNFIFTPIHNFGSYWVTSALWFGLVGALVSSLGLFLMSRSLAAHSEGDATSSDLDHVIR